ncbi:MAG: hypothetical protein HUJ51_05940 [Eggerthellaceae bacterium]|nr:hypothetical protein [Eggerthellaceae bacterium]
MAILTIALISCLVVPCPVIAQTNKDSTEDVSYAELKSILINSDNPPTKEKSSASEKESTGQNKQKSQNATKQSNNTISPLNSEIRFSISQGSKIYESFTSINNEQYLYLPSRTGVGPYTITASQKCTIEGSSLAPSTGLILDE